jgi:hypothetical protein
MLRDIGGSVWGTLVFALAMLPPGYWVARWLNFNDFRTRGVREQMAWSLALSLGAGTLPLVGLVWAAGVAVAGYVLAALALVTLVWVLRRRPAMDLSRREAIWFAVVAVAWAALVVASLVDIAHGNGLRMSVTSYDHALRTAFVSAVMRTGVVPVSPLYWPGHDAALRYYYFWYVTCAVVAKLAHISARQALIASCVWPMFAVGAMLALFARYLLAWRGSRLRRGWWIAVALLAVTGLDLLATIGAKAGGDALYADMEWWSIDQVTSWADTFLWVPHHAAGLVCCLLAMLLLFSCGEELSPRGRLKRALVAGLCLASAFGLSTYVTVGAAIVLAAWVAWRLFQSDRWRVLGAAAFAAFVAGVLLVPYLAQLLHHQAGEAGQTGRVLTLGVRQMLDPGMLSSLPGLSALRVRHAFAETQIAALVLLLPGYIAELGFFGLALALVQWAGREKSAGERTLLFWTWTGLAAATFLRSVLIETNDYGVRAVLVPQFFLLLVGVLALERSSGWLRRCLLGLAMIGVAGTTYQVALLRVFLPWHETHGDPAMAELSERNAALRDAYADFDLRVPQSARLQYDVSWGGYVGSAELMSADHQIVNSKRACNVSFGGEIAACVPIQRAVDRLYAGVSGTEAVGLCSGIGAQYLVATRWDRVWQIRESWVWSLPVAVERPEVRIVICGVGR